MTDQQLAYIKVVALVALTATGAGLVALQHAYPTWQWIGGVIAVVSVVVASLSRSPTDAKTIADQHETINRLSKHLDDIASADRIKR